MIGTKIYKTNMSNYMTVAKWANANGAMIEDEGDYYECVEIPKPTDAEKRAAALNALDNEYNRKISSIESEMAKAKAIEDEELYTELKEERELLVKEYTEKRGEI